MNYWHIKDIEDKISKNALPYCITVIDIDYFIRFCLRFEQSEIDEILFEMDSFLKEKAPDYSTVWKTNSDEFIILTEGCNKYDLAPEILQLKKLFKKQRFAKGSSKAISNVRMSYSAGISSFPSDGTTVEEIIRRAVVSMFMAKALRRDNVFVFPDDKPGKPERILAFPDAEISVILGDYGKIGFVREEENYADALFWEPQAIDVGSEGNLYVADQNNHAIIKCDGKTAKTIVGDGYYGKRGDGTEALRARLNKPTGIAFFENYVYITDTCNDLVRRVNISTNLIETVAGNGKTGYLGDSGLACDASLDKPGGVAVDKEGNVFINDIANNVIRRIDKKGIITTYAGSGQYGGGGDGGLAADAAFSEIYAIAVAKDSGDLYLADYFNHCIRKIDKETMIITTVVGCGKAGYSGDGGEPLEARLDRPVAICFSPDGDMFIAESGNSCIRYVSNKENKIYTLVGDGVFGIGSGGDINSFRLANPNGVTIDKKGNLYILDGANNRICKMIFNKHEN